MHTGDTRASRVLDEIRAGRGVSSPFGSWVSIGAHCVLLALLLLAGHRVWQVRPVSTRGGQHATVLYWASSVGTGIARTHQHGSEKLSPTRTASCNSPLPARLERQLDPDAQKAANVANASPAGSSTSKSRSDGTGNGSQEVTSAFPVYSPTPPLDRSLLPSADQNVVVDVNVSALGEVLDERLVHGLGNGIDQIILNTVKSWKFHPATQDGTPVASVAELVFPLNQKWRG